MSVLLEQRPGRKRSQSHLPVLQTMGYTLDISMRFLASDLMGRGSLERGDELLRWWARSILTAGNVALVADGQEHMVPGKPYVVMSNHRSLLDIPALFLATPGSLRMVLKEELTRIPIWGRALVASGFIPIDRGNKARAIAQLEVAKAHLSRGVCVWIAPEGTRSRDGELGPFKKGGFHMALQLGIPIVPVWIQGTETIIPPQSFRVQYNGRVHLRFGRPIATQGYLAGDIEALMAKVRQAMLDLSMP